MRYAIIQNGVVTNVVEWDGETPWEHPEGSTRLLCPDGVGPGFNSRDGVIFTPPVPPVQVSRDLTATVSSLTPDQQEAMMAVLQALVVK